MVTALLAELGPVVEPEASPGRLGCSLGAHCWGEEQALKGALCGTRAILSCGLQGQPSPKFLDSKMTANYNCFENSLRHTHGAGQSWVLRRVRQ